MKINNSMTIKKSCLKVTNVLNTWELIDIALKWI